MRRNLSRLQLLKALLRVELGEAEKIQSLARLGPSILEEEVACIGFADLNAVLPCCNWARQALKALLCSRAGQVLPDGKEEDE